MEPFIQLSTFIVNVLASLTATVLYGYKRDQSAKTLAREFNKRANIFNRHISQFLEKVLLHIYPELKDRLLSVKINGREKLFPVVPLIRDYGSILEKNPIIISKTIAREKDESMHNDNLIDFIRDTGRNVREGPAFRLLTIGENHELIAGITTYFRALSTCDRYYYNMIRSFPQRPTKFRLAVLRHHKLFKSWKKDVSRMLELTSFNHISAALGISVFTVFHTGDGTNYKYLCIRNSNEKNGASDRHVIPSFMYEPMTDSINEQVKELDIAYQVLREFAEEILGLKEFEGMLNRGAIYAALLKNDACKSLCTLLYKGGAKLKITGLWLDLLRLRPEITCVLLVEDSDYYKKYRSEFRGSWEQKLGAVWANLSDHRYFEELLSDIETPMCPPGVAAIVSGRDYCVKYLGISE